MLPPVAEADAGQRLGNLPQMRGETGLRVLAMVAVGATRLASETFNQEAVTAKFGVAAS